MPYGRSLLFLPLLGLLACAEDQPEGPKKMEPCGIRRILASIQMDGKVAEVVVEGEGSLPDSAVIDVSVEHRGELCGELRGSVCPKEGIFSMRLSTEKTFYPGYYVVVAQVVKRLTSSNHDVVLA